MSTVFTTCKQELLNQYWFLLIQEVKGLTTCMRNVI
jgi:hypothetical protein